MDTYGVKTTPKRYPYISIVPNDTTYCVCEALSEGEMNLSLEYKGQERVVKAISMSAYNISKLLRTADGVTFHIAIGKSLQIHTVEDYLEGVNLWTSLL